MGQVPPLSRWKGTNARESEKRKLRGEKLVPLWESAASYAAITSHPCFLTMVSLYVFPQTAGAGGFIVALDALHLIFCIISTFLVPLCTRECVIGKTVDVVRWGVVGPRSTLTPWPENLTMMCLNVFLQTTQRGFNGALVAFLISYCFPASDTGMSCGTSITSRSSA